MHFGVSAKKPSSASSATAVADPDGGAVDVTALMTRLVDGYREADGLRKRCQELKDQLPELGRKVSKIAAQRDVIEVVGQDADTRIRQASAPLLAAKKEIQEIPSRISQIGRQLRADIEDVRLTILDQLRSKYLVGIDKIAVGRIAPFLREARTEADAFEPVLRRWNAYAGDLGWKPIDNGLCPAALVSRWQAALADLAAFRARLK